MSAGTLAKGHTPELLHGSPIHYGHHVAELGEDGDTYGVSGHVEPRRAIAAVLRYLRVDCGIPADDVARWYDTPRVNHRWLVHVDEGDLDGGDHGWVWADDQHRQPITVVEL